MTIRGIILAQRAVTRRGAADFSVDISDQGSSYVAFEEPGVGSLNSGWNYIRGRKIRILATTASADFLVRITGNSAIVGSSLGQNFFKTLVVVDGGGTPQTFQAADATYTNPGGEGLWQWGDGASPVWEAADDTETKRVYLF
jgi:hypothetical protein